MPVTQKKAQEIIDFWFKKTPAEKDLKETKNLMYLLKKNFLKILN
mgnify:CR=1 FL=1